MKNHLQRLLSLLCVLALVLGCVSAYAESQTTVQYETRVLTTEWDDDNNIDKLRTSFTATYSDGKTYDLTEANGWTAEASVPAGTADVWEVNAPTGYTKAVTASSTMPGVSTVRLSHDGPSTTTVPGEIVWDDDDDAGKIRPDSVKVILLADGEAYGEPVDAKSPNYKLEWDKVPVRKPETNQDLTFSVKAVQTPAGYTVKVEGTKITFTLLRSSLTLSVDVSGYPADADLSSLSLRVDGPDPSMPQTLSWSDVSGGSYSFGNVLPGAYLVMGSAPEIEGYTMDTANSRISDAVYANPGEPASLTYKYAYKEPEAIEDVDPDYDPTANLGSLSFEIIGPDKVHTPMKVNYSQFTNGTYKIPENLVPGTYTIVERNAESLVNYYVLSIDSVTGAVIEVKAGDDGAVATAKLYNKYVPAPTPEPDAEFVDVPVTKSWTDSNNKDGNRPDSVTVRLYADGVEVNSHVLTAAENWNYTFTDLPRYKEDHVTEIVYTVNEDAVPMYSVQINGYNLVNVYQPEVTSLTVAKRWNDENNKNGKRPKSIFMTLKEGEGAAAKIVTVVELNDANGWIKTIENLPTVVDGRRAVYTWTEQGVMNYFMEAVQQTGATVTFTNKYFEPVQTQGGPQKRTGTPKYDFIPDYETALGMDVIINHVGDCFD